MKPYFVNEAITKGITDYLNSKDKPESILYNSFLVVVIRMLVNIYNELDILNPYRTSNEMAFDNNLMKYGASKEEIERLKMLIDNFYQIDSRSKNNNRREENIYFIETQKSIIDLFNQKRLNFGVDSNSSKEFFDLLYTPGTSNALRLSYNYLNADNIYEVAEYYQEKMQIKAPKEENNKDLLGFDVYKLFNISISDLSKMNNEEISSLNKQIYQSFDIKDNAVNKEYQLSEKIKELTRQNNQVTTGNGYVDILLIMSIIVTVIMIVVIFSTLVF